MADQEQINEGYQTSHLLKTRQNKMDALTGAFAVGIARRSKDPLYDRMIRFKKAYKVVKKQILMKYGMKGKAAARSAATAHK